MTGNELAKFLEQHRQAIAALRVVTGFDAFVDEVIAVVEQRTSLTEFSRVERMEQFAESIAAAAGHNSLREIVVTATHPGGCAVNMGDALATFGVGVETYATFGQPVHAVFADYAARATIHSWGVTPGRTLAFEFANGKQMFSSVSQLADFTSEYVTARLAEGQFTRAAGGAALIAFTDWTLFPHMTDVWRLLEREVLAQLTHQPWIFVDLVDPTGRDAADIRDMLDAMRRFVPHGQVVLGLNQREANVVARVLGTVEVAEPTVDATTAQAAELRAELGLAQVVIHSQARAVSATIETTAAAESWPCANPKKSTGAGDRFNAGYALGLMLDLAPHDCLTLGHASAGLFVRKGRSASIAELVGFLQSDNT